MSMDQTQIAPSGDEPSLANGSLARELFHVVGIGASAGGLEALEQFFEHVPVDSGMCYVVVQHLSPDFRSMMDELLARRTRIPIVRVDDGVVIEPNHIYLMPPRKEMILTAGRLHLTDKDSSQSLALPIDRFLRSLAQDCRGRSVAVILSGTGSDGSRGVREIHDAGGLVVTQCEGSAKFDGMPRSARETGLVDLDLPAAEMPDAILRIVQLKLSPASEDESRPIPDVGLQAIFRMLRREFGIDFSQYKPTTLLRRLERRLLLKHAQNVESYVNELTNNPAELGQLYRDLMIGVTQFFRDFEAFERLAHEELPRLLGAVEEGQEFRVWVAGCSTGEEPYSIAMLIHEQLEKMNRRPPVRIFATDAHKASLDFAGLGCYSEAALERVSPQRREQFFLRRGDGFQVVPMIRKMIVFAPHDLLKDSPFTRLDLVTCRNLLIYLQSSVQKKVLSIFHFGLKTGGTLFLGPSESPGDLSDEFESMDDRWKFYRKRRDIRLRPDFRMMPTPAPPQRPGGLYSVSLNGSERLQQSLYDRLLEEHMPPSFLVNDRRELVHTFGGAGKFLRVADGRTTPQFLDLLTSELKMILTGALARVEKQHTAVVFTDIRLSDSQGQESLNRLTVKPLADRISGSTSYLIILEEVGRPALPRDEPTVDLTAASFEQVQSLELQLSHTRENLQALIEEQESSNEELQATNEELVASNEELQSTNEELHSVNEELYTVNAEYQQKIEELTQVKADLENLLRATDVGILFLDRNLCIRRFTPQIGTLFNLLPHDVGRSIAGFTNLLEQPLIESLQGVLASGQPIETEVTDHAGHNYLQRILPYRIGGAAVEGIVLSLIDITRLKSAEAQSLHLSAIVQSSAEAIIGRDLHGTILSWNRGAEALYGYKAEEVIGRDSIMLYADEYLDQYRLDLELIRSGQSHCAEQKRKCINGELFDVLRTISPILNANGAVVGSSSICLDITGRKRAEREINMAIRNRDRFLAMLSHELRNPLGAILNAAQVLDHTAPQSEQIASACQVVLRQADQMRRLLDDLLDVARVTQNKIVLRLESCRLGDVASHAIESVEALLAANEQQLQTTGLDLDLRTHGDPARLQQVVVNLLKNASKYSPPHSTIGLTLQAEGDFATLRVQDPGVGIPGEMLDRVFDLFFQSNETLDRSDGGMGVGLTLVKAIVELHGGTVVPLSHGPGRGSEFLVRLPLLTSEASAGPSLATRRLPRASTRPLRIAIVEDNSDSREMLLSLLTFDGHEVRSAPDGAQGIELISSWQPDVALVDIGLPELDGFEVARRVRATPFRSPPFLIALTGYGFATDRENAASAGFDIHLVKPLRHAELDTVLEQIGARFDES